MKMKMITGLAAAALTAGLLAATPASAEVRTFPYGTYGGAKYDADRSHNLRKPVTRSIKRNNSALRPGTFERRNNFSSGKRPFVGNRYNSRIKLSR